MNDNKRVVIDERLAGALLTLLDLGTFPLQAGQIREVYTALRAAVDNAGVEVLVVSDDEAVADVVGDFPGGVI